MAIKRCNFCAKKLNKDDKCENKDCVDYKYNEIKEDLEKDKDE